MRDVESVPITDMINTDVFFQMHANNVAQDNDTPSCRLIKST